MGMIFFLSHQPYDFVEQLPNFNGFDKLLHVIAYGSLAASLLYGLQPFINTTTMPIAGMIVVLFCFLYGLSDEFHQSFIPGRFVSGWDVLADTSGAVLVVLWWMRREGKGERL
jgi:VanZ family protein